MVLWRALWYNIFLGVRGCSPVLKSTEVLMTRYQTAIDAIKLTLLRCGGLRLRKTLNATQTRQELSCARERRFVAYFCQTTTPAKTDGYPKRPEKSEIFCHITKAKITLRQRLIAFVWLKLMKSQYTNSSRHPSRWGVAALFIPLFVNHHTIGDFLIQ